MSWTTPRTWTIGEVLTAANLNTHVRDNISETAVGKVTTQGDTVHATAANALARLAKGAAGQVYRMNAGATVPEWGGYSVPSGLIAMWHGTIASIPTGWVICDGNNGTPNLLAQFVKGVATAATNPGATGGNLTHTHSNHTLGVGTQTDADSANQNISAHSSENHEPPYYAVAFIMKS